MSTLHVGAVSFRYPAGPLALDAVDLSVGTGDCLAIVGQNGAGKSTLVRHLNGLLRPDAGRVLLDGADTRGMTVARLARVVGLAFQDADRQIFAGSVRREIAFGARNVGLRGAGLASLVEEVACEVGLVDVLDANPHDLGYSRRKLLGLASVLAMQTPVVVLDEPTTGQDARGVERVAGVVTRLRAGGRSVIAISHDMRFVAENFPRVVVMRAGRVILQGSPRDVFARANWSLLGSTYLEPPHPAVVGDRLGLGSTPTDADLMAALAGSR